MGLADLDFIRMMPTSPAPAAKPAAPPADWTTGTPNDYDVNDTYGTNYMSAATFQATPIADRPLRNPLSGAVYGGSPAPAASSAASAAPVKLDPAAAAAKVATAPPAASTGAVGKVKGYLEIAGDPSTRTNLNADGTITGVGAGGGGGVTIMSKDAGDIGYRDRVTDKVMADVNAHPDYYPAGITRQDVMNRVGEASTPTVSEPIYGEGGRVLGYRSAVATPANSFQGRSVAEILGPDDSGRAGRAVALGTLQNEAAKTSQDASLKQAQGYKAIMEGQKAGVEMKYLPDEKRADIGLKTAEAVSKEADARSKLFPNIEKLMKDGSPADAAWATKAQAGITSGTHTWAPETQFTMLDDAGKTSVPYKMYGTIPASAAGKQAYDGLWSKYLADVKTYNDNIYKSDKDFAALKQNRAAFLNGMRSLGLRIDPLNAAPGAK